MNIYSAANPTEAHILCELLKQHNIKAEVRGEGIFSLRGELPMTEESDPYVWLLNPRQQSEATQIVDEFKHHQHNSPEWRCNHCNEINEGQFAICWQCGESAPD